MHVISSDLPNLHRDHYPPKMGTWRSVCYYLQVCESQMESSLLHTNFLILFISGGSSFSLRDLTEYIFLKLGSRKSHR